MGKLVQHQKLVRDRIPEIIIQNGHSASTRIMLPAEYEEALYTKLIEEIKELIDAPEDKRLEELADINEVLLALATLHGYTANDLQNATVNKRLRNGGFAKRVWLESTES